MENVTFSKRNAMSMVEFKQLHAGEAISEITYRKNGVESKFLRIGVKPVYAKAETIEYLFDQSIPEAERLQNLQYMECRRDTPEDIAKGEAGWVPCVCRIGGTVTRSISL